MEKWFQKLAIVTGASSGIGAAVAEALAREGVNVVGISRRTDAIVELARKTSTFKGQIHALECDVGEPEAIDKAFDWIEEKFGGVDILVNCAGIINNAKLFDLSRPSESYLDVNNVNFCGSLLMTRRAYKTMRAKPFGYIVNINSINGHQHTSSGFAQAGMSIYIATKHALVQLTQLMKLEISQAGKNIRVTSISPGAVYTNLDVAGDLKHHGYDRLWDAMPHLQPSDVADQVIYVLSTKDNVNISELIVEPLGSQL